MRDACNKNSDCQKTVTNLCYTLRYGYFEEMMDMHKPRAIAVSLDLGNVQRSALLALLAVAAYLLLCSPAFAVTVGSVLCGAVAMVLLDIGRAVASVAVIAMGAGILIGKVTWGQAMMMVGGIALLFGAGTIVTTLTTNSEALIGTGLAMLVIGTSYTGDAASALVGCGSYGGAISSVTDAISGAFR